MNDIIFERPGWELLLDSLESGSTVSAVRLISVLEPENEDEVERAFRAFFRKGISLDISGLPKDYGCGEMEKYLRQEEQQVKSGNLLTALSESDPVRLYMEELARTPAQGDPAVLTHRILKGDESAREKLANLYLHRVVDIAQEYTGRGMLLLDLLQEGNLGLWQCVLEYKAGDFATQADWWIRQSISRQILIHARENGVLRSMQSNMEAYQQADKRLLTSLGRNATVEEVAVDLGITPEQADVIRDMILNASTMEKVKQSPEQQLPDEDQAVEDTAYFQSRQRIDEMLSCLSEREVQILSLRFGLDGSAPMTAEAVGDKLGMDAGQVVAVEAAALEKLRKT